MHTRGVIMADNLNELLFAFMEHMKVRNYAKATMTAYSRYLRTFLDYLRKNNITDLKQVTRDIISTFCLNP
jgi:site-specific recombinase XerD